MRLDDIRVLARDAHRTQRDKQGRDYFDAHLRPIAEAAAVFGETVEAAAWLHDIVEDAEYTGTTLDDLRRLGVPSTVVSAVDSVSRRPAESYRDLIARACQDPVGSRTKFVDNAWNVICNPDLAVADPAKAKSLLNDRYLPARGLLLDAQPSITAIDVHRIDLILRRHRDRLLAPARR